MAHLPLSWSAPGVPVDCDPETWCLTFCGPQSLESEALGRLLAELSESVGLRVRPVDRSAELPWCSADFGALAPAERQDVVREAAWALSRCLRSDPDPCLRAAHLRFGCPPFPVPEGLDPCELLLLVTPKDAVPWGSWWRLSGLVPALLGGAEERATEPSINVTIA